MVFDSPAKASHADHALFAKQLSHLRTQTNLKTRMEDLQMTITTVPLP